MLIVLFRSTCQANNNVTVIDDDATWYHISLHTLLSCLDIVSMAAMLGMQHAKRGALQPTALLASI